MAQRRQRNRYRPEPEPWERVPRYADGAPGAYDPGDDPPYELDYDGYGGDPGAYDWAEEPRGGLEGLLEYLGDHNLSLFLLMLLLPPVGIALLWARRRFRRRGRVLLTGMTLLWVALLAFVLVGRPLLSRRAAPVDEVVEAPQTGDGPVDMGATNPVVVSDEELAGANTVFVTASGPFYHQLQDCRGLSTTEEITHTDTTSAVSQGLMSCPYCLGGQYTDALWDLKFINTQTQDQSGIIVYCSATNPSFHTDAKCSALTDGRGVTLLDAMLMGKVFCQYCCPEAARQVFCTLDGSYYHYDGECSGMRDAQLVTLGEALVLGKSACPTCIKGQSGASLVTSDANTDATYYVYATKNGTYYHIKKNCSGMQNAKKVSLKQMLAARRPACPKCCPNVEMTVFMERGNPYYHSAQSCSDMKAPTATTLVEALANGLSRCPKCWTSAS